MKFVSTRGGSMPVRWSAALANGLAPDGGLYFPGSTPAIAAGALARCGSLAETARTLLRPFFEGDALEPALDDICDVAFAFDAPLRALDPTTALLELFHGPTCAFKDYGARFLAECLDRIEGRPPTTILVATSGDTGAAVAAAFHRRARVRVVILYPDGLVSRRQAHQLGAFDDNVRAFRVAGSFDDCQALVKRALSDAGLRARIAVGSANSISLGRWLPQMAYFARAAVAYGREAGRPLDFVVPTGNLGNALACAMARAMGAPIGRIDFACNANRTIADYFETGSYAPRPSVPTLANAMDVGAPSNFERLPRIVRGLDAQRRAFGSSSASDDDIRAAIVDAWRRHGVAVCPHTAVGLHHRSRRHDAALVAVAATAHPAKFDTIVEPLIGCPVEPPASLAALLARPSRSTPLANDYEAFAKVLLADA